MAKKEKQTYPRTRKEMLRIMRAADKKGQLLEMVLEEFAKHPFSMPGLCKQSCAYNTSCPALCDGGTIGRCKRICGNFR